MANLPLALLRVGKTIADRPTAPTSKQQMFLDLGTGILYAPTDDMLWQAISGGSGETNTVSNVGTTGVGVFKQKTDVDFELKKIAAASNKVSISDNVAENQVDIDVIEGNITLNNLGGTLSIAKGGTGQTAQTAAMDALSPSTTKGDVLVDDGANLIRLGVGTNGQFLAANSAQASGVEWSTPAGSGDVSKAGTPADNQLAVWTGDGIIEGDASLTFDSTTDTLNIAASGNLSIGAATILSDATGTTTLQNIDAIDAATELTLEAAIDSLINLITTGTITTGTWSATDIAVDSGGTGASTASDARSNLGLTIGSNIQAWAAALDAVTGTNTGDEIAASLTAAGIIEIATVTETNTGTDTTRAVSPNGLDGWVGSAQVATLGTIATGIWQGDAINQTYLTGQSGTNTGDEVSATTSVEGIVELATEAEVTTGTDTTRAITPSSLPLQIQNSKYVYAADAGSTDAYAITLSPALSAYTAGQIFHFKANTANTGAATLNVNSLGAKSILKNHDVALVDGDIEASQFVSVIYDGAQFQMLSQLGNAAIGGSGETNTASNVGTAGVGVFKQKTDVNLEFKKINAGSSKITITDDTGSDELDIDVVEANITLDNLGGTLGVAKGGTGASTASGARTNLGIVIGTDVQAHDARLDDITALSLADGNIIVGNGANWVAEAGATARTSLGVTIGSDIQAWAAALDAVTGTNTGDEAPASTTVSGISELATTAETSTGTDTVRTIPVSALPLQIQDSKYNYVLTTGSVNAYAASFTPTPSAYVNGQVFYLKASFANTDAATLAINGQAAKSIVTRYNVPLVANDIVSGMIFTVAYDVTGDNFQLLSPVATVANGAASPISSSLTAIAGEDLTDRKIAYIATDDKIYHIDSDATPPKIGTIRGFIDGSVLTGATATLVTFGELNGFSALTKHGRVYADSTAGDVTQTRPVPTKGGAQVVIADMGYARSADTIFVEPKPIQYNLRAAMVQNGTLTIEHHSDPEGYGRDLAAYISESVAGAVLEEYLSSNQDAVRALRDRVPTYTSDLCTGGTASESSALTTEEVSKAFDNNTSTQWTSTDVAHPHWIEYNFGADKTIRRYTIRSRDSCCEERTPKDFSLQYFDGSTWQDADTRSGETGWVTAEQRVYDVSTPYTAQRWRVYITASDGSATYASINELEMMEISAWVDGSDKLAQTISLGVGETVASKSLYLRKVGSPTGTITIRLETVDGSNDPTGTLADANATTTLLESDLTTSFVNVLETFTNYTPGTGIYAIVSSTDRAASETDYVEWGCDASSPSYAGGEGKSYDGATWTNEGIDFIFGVNAPGTIRPAQINVDWWSSTHADMVNRYDNGVGLNLETKTTFKCTRVSGFDDVTVVVNL